MYFIDIFCTCTIIEIINMHTNNTGKINSKYLTFNCLLMLYDNMADAESDMNKININ